MQTQNFYSASSLELSPFLSCKELVLESFLSCNRNSESRKPSTQNRNLNHSYGKSLSCENSKVSESRGQSPSSYRAENGIGAKSPIRPTLIVGIDPGITGAIAFISSSSTQETPKFVAVYDFPTKEEKIGKRLKLRIDIIDLSLLIETYSKDINLAVIEEVGQIGTKADPFSAFVFGFATGLVHGVLSSHGVKILTAKPLIWKAALGLDANKEKSIAKAIALFPESSQFLKRKKDHGRAEAILLAHFAWKLGGGK